MQRSKIKKVFHFCVNRLLTDTSHETSCLFRFLKAGINFENVGLLLVLMVFQGLLYKHISSTLYTISQYFMSKSKCK